MLMMEIGLNQKRQIEDKDGYISLISYDDFTIGNLPSK